VVLIIAQKEYHELCAKVVQLLLSSASSGPVDDRHVNEHVFPNLPTSGAKIGRYINGQHYQDGLFSEVFKAVDPDADTNDRNRLVALKITTPDLERPPHNSKREARILVAAKGDYIIKLLETFQQAGGHFVLAFPFMPYGLDSLLYKHQLPDSARRAVLRDIFSALAHLHSLGIIHRDVKPSNVLLCSPSGPAHLSDFGIAWSPADPACEPAGEKILDVGTTCYRPPELLFGHQEYNEKLDMWAAGCVAAQVVCLNGKTLFDAGDLGSELALIRSMFETLGTPTVETWPEAEGFPDWGKMEFKKYEAKKWEEILPGAGEEELELVKSLVVYESGERLSAEEVRKTSFA
jgi:cyclin-dependent kinase